MSPPLQRVDGIHGLNQMEHSRCSMHQDGGQIGIQLGIVDPTLDLKFGLDRVHYIILTSRPLEDPTVVGWQETILSHPTCGGVPDGHGSRDLL